MAKYILGLTGLSCAGKSEAARILRELGAEILDADQIAHSAFEDEEIKAKLLSCFGEKILTDEKRIDRQKLADLVFTDNEKLSKLESIIHPWVCEKIKVAIQEFDDSTVVVLDAPLLQHAKLDTICNDVLFIAADNKTRLERAKSRGWDSAELTRRDKALQDKLHQENVIQIENNFKIEDLTNKINSVWRSIK